jgi:2-keto-4-pentenoate hydratase/2-oxohepta-3-ene-1,7-dioic acid hydratase in catechol pathway
MKIICVGRNYASHAQELNNEKPTSPVLFIKPDTALLKRGHEFYIPECTKNLHYELEICLKITKVGKHVPLQFAHQYYDSIALGLDFTARDWQDELKSKGLPWELAKAFDNSAYLGDFMPKSEFDMQNINFSLYKNKQKVQEGHSQEMIFGFDEIISYASQFFTLRIGDVIMTGTPAGVGPVAIGDVLEARLEEKPVFSLDIC